MEPMEAIGLILGLFLVITPLVIHVDLPEDAYIYYQLRYRYDCRGISGTSGNLYLYSDGVKLRNAPPRLFWDEQSRAVYDQYVRFDELKFVTGEYYTYFNSYIYNLDTLEYIGHIKTYDFPLMEDLFRKLPNIKPGVYLVDVNVKTGIEIFRPEDIPDAIRVGVCIVKVDNAKDSGDQRVKLLHGLHASVRGVEVVKSVKIKDLDFIKYKYILMLSYLPVLIIAILVYDLSMSNKVLALIILGLIIQSYNMTTDTYKFVMTFGGKIPSKNPDPWIEKAIKEHTSPVRLPEMVVMVNTSSMPVVVDDNRVHATMIINLQDILGSKPYVIRVLKDYLKQDTLIIRIDDVSLLLHRGNVTWRKYLFDPKNVQIEALGPLEEIGNRTYRLNIDNLSEAVIKIEVDETIDWSKVIASMRDFGEDKLKVKYVITTEPEAETGMNSS